MGFDEKAMAAELLSLAVRGQVGMAHTLGAAIAGILEKEDGRPE